MTDTVNIAVCDDEKNIRAYLVSLIKKQNIECSIMEYASADEYLPDGREYDLLFLDIEMGGSGVLMDGMELAGQFYRIHRGYLVNLFHVESYDRTEVRMANGDKLLLSRYKYDSFVQAYMEYISEES